ncbi:hypothetical protein DH2020_049357 [Rehmannia glutinosa]|uniref:Sulfotransferase n=1 Tax=Rehmannia glutinosa TaxID=99300 RepID=A0ABR0U319_REHGL
MEQKKCLNCISAQVDNNNPEDDFQELLQTLEQQTNWDGSQLVKYDRVWYPLKIFWPVLSAQKYFKAKDSNIILASIPKSGIVWLKVLAFLITNRSNICSTIDQNTLLLSRPHKVVPFLEFDLYLNEENPDLQHFSNPRIFSTHIPFKSLPDSIRESECKIIYVCRNPLDQFISERHFLIEKNKIEKGAVIELNESFDKFCQGINPFGPFWDHTLGYWNAHLKNHEKVLFLKYEDLKQDITFHIKKIAEFLKCPFTQDEEEQGRIEQISKLCSFENLNMKVNKTEYLVDVMEKPSFFRNSGVGDWTNYLTPAMAERFQKIMESKMEGSGLMFKI